MTVDELKRIVNGFPDYMDNDEVEVEMNVREMSRVLHALSTEDEIQVPIFEIEKCSGAGMVLIKI